MNIDFIAYQPDNYKIYLFDYTPVYQDNIPEQIYAATLDIANLGVTDGVYPTIDLFTYFYSSDRTDNHLYIITSIDLDLGDGQEIPDGVYGLTYIINNNFTKEYKFLVYRTVENRVIEINKASNYKVKVGKYDLENVRDCVDKGDLEQIRFANNLLDELKRYSTVDDEIEVIATLDKLQRLLVLIENEII